MSDHKRQKVGGQSEAVGDDAKRFGRETDRWGVYVSVDVLYRLPETQIGMNEIIRRSVLHCSNCKYVYVTRDQPVLCYAIHQLQKKDKARNYMQNLNHTETYCWRQSSTKARGAFCHWPGEWSNSSGLSEQHENAIHVVCNLVNWYGTKTACSCNDHRHVQSAPDLANVPSSLSTYYQTTLEQNPQMYNPIYLHVEPGRTKIVTSKKWHARLITRTLNGANLQ